MTVAELREWARLVVRYHGRGTQRGLARDVGMPEPSLTKFLLHGAGLAARFREPLQKHCSHLIPYSQRDQYRTELEERSGSENQRGSL